MEILCWFVFYFVLYFAEQFTDLFSSFYSKPSQKKLIYHLIKRRDDKLNMQFYYAIFSFCFCSEVFISFTDHQSGCWERSWNWFTLARFKLFIVFVGAHDSIGSFYLLITFFGVNMEKLKGILMYNSNFVVFNFLCVILNHWSVVGCGFYGECAALLFLFSIFSCSTPNVWHTGTWWHDQKAKTLKRERKTHKQTPFSEMTS